MCLQDYAIGFGTFCSEKRHTVTVGGEIIVAANPKRSLLIIGRPTGNPIWVQTINPPVATNGWNLGTSDQPMVLITQHHGNLPQMAWYGIATGGSGTISVWEGEFDVEQARQFMRKLGV